MDLSIIIVSWNVRELLQANLAAIFQSVGDFNFEVLVVDNNSEDGSAAMLRTDFPQVQLLVNTENQGFAKANNQAWNLAQGRFVLLLNPDMALQSDTLEKMIIWANQHPEAVVASCRLLTPKGEIIHHVRRFPKLRDQLLITLKVPHFWPAIVNKYLYKNFDYQRAAIVDSVRGSFFLINQASYQSLSNGIAPRLDERYFLWFEEVDFCRQVQQYGGQTWYTPVTDCIDQIGQSFKQVRTEQAQAYFSASMLKYFQKWAQPWQYQILRIIWCMIHAVFSISRFRFK